MKNKRNLTIVAIIIAAILIFSVYYFLTVQDENTSLTVLDRQWIESNENNIIDLSIINEVSIINYSGKGIVFDFLDSLEEDTGLTFNKLSYDYGDESKTEYAIKVVDEKDSEDILIYQDNYVLVSSLTKSFLELSEIQNVKIGVVNDLLEETNKYLTTSVNTSYKGYETYEDLEKALEDSEVDMIVLPKLPYFDEIAESDTLNINYNITEMTEDYVISLGDDSRLNSILTKYFNNWSSKNLEQSFYDNFALNYFDFANITEKDEANFRSKRYMYGFVDDAPYDTTLLGGLLGINSNFIKSFSKASGIEINYQKYNDFNDLTEAFNTNEIDFYFNRAGSMDYKIDVYNTVSPVSENIVIISKIENDITINSVYSLNNQTVLTVKNSKTSEYLINLDIKIVEFDTIQDLLDNKKTEDIIVIDEASYKYYENGSLSNYKVDYDFNLKSEYTYTLRNIESNEVFNEYFDFYLSFINKQQVVNKSFEELLSIGNKPEILRMILIGLSSIVAFILVFFGIKLIKPKKKVVKLKKEDKLRYVDMLTSLKNRSMG